MRDHIKHRYEILPNHECLRQLVPQELIELILQELDKLTGLETGMVVDPNLQLKFLAAIHILSEEYLLCDQSSSWVKSATPRLIQ